MDSKFSWKNTLLELLAGKSKEIVVAFKMDSKITHCDLFRCFVYPVIMYIMEEAARLDSFILKDSLVIEHGLCEGEGLVTIKILAIKN